MIRAIRDAAGTLLGYLFQCVVDALWGHKKKPDDHPDYDGESNS